jgi:hypothetical protein
MPNYTVDWANFLAGFESQSFSIKCIMFGKRELDLKNLYPTLSHEMK